MKLNEKIYEPGSGVPYKLDTQDGQFCEAQMRASVAEEIVRTAECVERCDDEEYGLIVNNRMMFPVEAFTYDLGEFEKIPEHGSRPAGKRSGTARKEPAGKVRGKQVAKAARAGE